VKNRVYTPKTDRPYRYFPHRNVEQLAKGAIFLCSPFVFLLAPLFIFIVWIISTLWFSDPGVEFGGIFESINPRFVYQNFSIANASSSCPENYEALPLGYWPGSDHGYFCENKGEFIRGENLNVDESLCEEVLSTDEA